MPALFSAYIGTKSPASSCLSTQQRPPPDVYQPTGHPRHHSLQSLPPQPQSLEWQVSPSTAQRRQSSFPSAEYALTPQISGQSEWQRGEWQPHGSSPPISPVYSRSGSDGYSAGRSTRIGSISEEVTRSPAREYADQQTPWALSMPEIGEDSSDWVDATQSSIRQSGGDEQMQAGQYGLGPPSGPPRQDSMMPSRYRNSGGYFPSRGPYGSPTQPFQQRQYYESSGGNREPLAGQYTMPHGPPRRLSGNRSDAYQWAPSSYTGRRDDPTISEEQLEMRGASYPGQEWAPVFRE